MLRGKGNLYPRGKEHENRPVLAKLSRMHLEEDLTEEEKNLRGNDGKCYTNEMNKAADREIQRQMEEFKEKKRKEKELEQKKIEDEISRKYEKRMEELEKKMDEKAKEREKEIKKLIEQQQKDKEKFQKDIEQKFVTKFGKEHENRPVMAKMSTLYLGEDLTEEDIEKFGVKENQRRMVFIGITGAGKSSTGNTILGEGKFFSRSSPKSVTKQCSSGEAFRFGKNILLVDTPGLLDTHFCNEVVSKAISRCVALTIPGPHVFIIVIKIGRFTKQDVDMVEEYERFFGERLYDYAVVLFTGRDDIENEGSTMSEFVQNVPQTLKDILQKCSNRYIAFNNRANETTKSRDVRMLLDITEQILRVNDGKCYTNQMYKEAEREIQRKMEEFKEKKRKGKELNELKQKKMEDEIFRKFEKKLEELTKRLELQKRRNKK